MPRTESRVPRGGVGRKKLSRRKHKWKCYRIARIQHKLDCMKL